MWGAVFVYVVAAEPTSLDPGLLNQLPVLVLGVAVGMLFITGKVVSGRAFEKLELREESQRVEMAQLRQALEEKILPALIRAGSLTEQTISALDSTTVTLVEMNAALQSAVAILPQLRDGSASLDQIKSLVHQLEKLVSRIGNVSETDLKEELARVNQMLDQVLTAFQGWE